MFTSHPAWKVLLLAFLSMPLQGVLADTNGMDMSMDGTMSLAAGNMLSYLHFTPGDIVWFQGWVPSNAGAMTGACIGLFLLALFDRWLAACRSLMELHWRKQAQIKVSNKMNTGRTRPLLDYRLPASSESSLAKGKETTEGASSPERAKPTTSPSSPFRTLMPFVPTYDIPRGIVQAAQSALEFAFMLVVMTYQVAFIISIVIGLGVGETLFGRYNVQAHIY